MTKKRHILHKLFWIAGLLGLFLIFILTTNPETVALPLLIVPFILIGLVVYQAVLLLFLVFKGKTPERYPRKVIAGGVSALTVCLLLLQSLHQLTWRDSLLAILFIGLFWLYVWRADFLK